MARAAGLLAIAALLGVPFLAAGAPVAAASVRGTTTVVAAGDVACKPPVVLSRVECSQGRTAALVQRINPSAVLMLGDAQDKFGTIGEFHARNAYVDTWGRFLGRTIPVAGNHDWMTAGAAGYRLVFADRTGGRFYHSRDLRNGWRLIGLDSNCVQVGGCSTSSPQARFLRRDLAANDGRPTIVIWHHPRWSSGQQGDNPAVDALWRIAVGDRDVQLVLNGHDHDYERMKPISPTGAVSASGARMFVVGTGGAFLTRRLSGLDPRSATFSSAAHGVLQLTLRPDGYDWRFRAARGALTDWGSSPLRPRG